MEMLWRKSPVWCTIESSPQLFAASSTVVYINKRVLWRHSEFPNKRSASDECRERRGAVNEEKMICASHRFELVRITLRWQMSCCTLWSVITMTSVRSSKGCAHKSHMWTSAARLDDRRCNLRTRLLHETDLRLLPRVDGQTFHVQVPSFSKFRHSSCPFGGGTPTTVLPASMRSGRFTYEEDLLLLSDVVHLLLSLRVTEKRQQTHQNAVAPGGDDVPGVHTAQLSKLPLPPTRWAESGVDDCLDCRLAGWSTTCLVQRTLGTWWSLICCCSVHAGASVTFFFPTAGCSLLT